MHVLQHWVKCAVISLRRFPGRNWAAHDQDIFQNKHKISCTISLSVAGEE